VSVVTQVDKLVAPLRDDSESIFEESDDNEESADSWEVSAVHMSVPARETILLPYPHARCFVLDLLTYGLIGSETVSRKSSILPVVSRTFSSGLGSLVA